MTQQTENQIVYGLVTILMIPIVVLLSIVALSWASTQPTTNSQSKKPVMGPLPLSEGGSIPIESAPLQGQTNNQSPQGSSQQSPQGASSQPPQGSSYELQ